MGNKNGYHNVLVSDAVWAELRRLAFEKGTSVRRILDRTLITAFSFPVELDEYGRAKPKMTEPQGPGLKASEGNSRFGSKRHFRDNRFFKRPSLSESWQQIPAPQSRLSEAAHQISVPPLITSLTG